MPTPEHEEEVRQLFDLRFSASSKSSIAAALVHWHAVRQRYLWAPIIKTGDAHRGSKLCVFVFYLMAHSAMYPSSTISNYVWALCAHMQLQLQADPRVNVIGWPFFMTAVTVLCFVPSEPRRRVPTSLIRDALFAVDRTDFVQVQTALLVLFLYFTFQRSELPCPKTYDGMDPLKHLYVKHMQPDAGGSRWAVGVTKADPRAERLSGDAGPGREWIVVGEVNDDLFDMRTWLVLFYGMLPPGPRSPDSPYFVAHDKVRPLIYSVALADFREFLTNGGCTNAEDFGLHGIRSEAFVTCSGAVDEDTAVIHGGWASAVTASRYDRVTMQVAKSIAPKMVAFHLHDAPADAEGTSDEALRSHGDLGVVANRAAARATGNARPTQRVHQPSNLPAGWQRVWHPTTGRKAGYSTFEGPNGVKARTIREAQAIANGPAPPPTRTAVPAVTQPSVVVPADLAEHVAASSVRAAASAAARAGCVHFPNDLSAHVTFHDRPSSRPPPRIRS